MHEEMIKNIETGIKEVLQRNRVIKGGLFGSFLTEMFSENSDIDVLVELPEGSGLLEFIRIKQELEDLLDRPVDLVEYSSIKPILREKILNQEKRIYGE